MNDLTRDTIKARIEQAHERDAARADGSFAEKLGEQANEAKDKFVSFAKEHPVATIAGGLVLGIAIAAMFKGPRKAAAAGGARAAGLAAIGSEIALAFAGQLLENAQEAGRSGVQKAGELGQKAQDAGREAGANMARVFGRR